MTRYIYSVDAGIGHLGLAVICRRTLKVVLQRCLITSSLPNETQAQGNVRRCKELARMLNNLRQIYRPAFFCAEIPTGGALSSRAMSHMSMATAFISTYCAAKGYELLAVTPIEIKKLVSRQGPVSKDQVAEFVEKTLGISVPQKKAIREHIADALAAYIVAKTKFRSKFI